MIRTKCDTRGRVYLSETLRSRFGESFVVIETGAGIMLLPAPVDTVVDLATIGKALRGLSVTEAKERIRERARKETLRKLFKQ